MDLFLGVDVGTLESKGVLVDGQGTIHAQAVRLHEMIVPALVGRSIARSRIGGVT